MSIRRLVPADASAYHTLMLDAYERHPDAFTSTVVERAALPLAWWEARLSVAPQPANLVLGAMHGKQLVGAVGLAFESREKLRHKATLFGMVVLPEFARTGLGCQLVVTALEQARAHGGVVQVQLTVTQGNSSAQRLYERCGFVAFGVEPQAIAVGSGFVAKVHMMCSLTAAQVQPR